VAVGLMRCGVGLAGVTVFSVPMNEAVRQVGVDE
jgi:hypothetical protein